VNFKGNLVAFLMIFSINNLYANKKVMLTGAAGFIDSNFLKHTFNRYEDYKFIVLASLTYAGNLDNIPDYIKQSGRFESFYGSVNNTNLKENYYD